MSGFNLPPGVSVNDPHINPPDETPPDGRKRRNTLVSALRMATPADLTVLIEANGEFSQVEHVSVRTIGKLRFLVIATKPVSLEV